MNSIAIIGAGAWGTALALAAARATLDVKLWSYTPEQAVSINQYHENPSRFPGVSLDHRIQATTNPQETAHADLVILVPPAQFMRDTCKTFQSIWHSDTPLVIASKGIEKGSNLLMSEVVREYFPLNPLLVLSGPSFATDVARQCPTALTLAAESIGLSKKIAPLLSSSHFRLYASDDIIGAQLGGACKNIIAIACGIVNGLALGDNAHAALLTRGLAEISRLGCEMGAKLETFLGLSGVGDMFLTASSHQSRNHSFGRILAQGTALDALLSKPDTLVEGVHTVTGAISLAKKHNVEMPITFAVYELLNCGGTVENLMTQLLNRSIKIEGL